MRNLTLLLAAALVAGCTAAPQQAAYSARQTAELEQVLAGKVAGKAQDCLSTFRTNDMVRISDDTLLFRDGSKRVYRNNLIGSCSGLGSTHYALVTNSFGSGGGRLCRGDIAHTVDLASGMRVGSCALGEFIPYTRPGA